MKLGTGHWGPGCLQHSGETADSSKNFLTMLASPPLGSAGIVSVRTPQEDWMTATITCSSRNTQALQEILWALPLCGLEGQKGQQSTPSSPYAWERKWKPLDHKYCWLPPQPPHSFTWWFSHTDFGVKWLGRQQRRHGHLWEALGIYLDMTVIRSCYGLNCVTPKINMLKS